jgi:hypothetical protein
MGEFGYIRAISKGRMEFGCAARGESLGVSLWNVPGDVVARRRSRREGHSQAAQQANC